MTFTKDKVKSTEDLKKLLDKAIQKARVTKENDLCKYLPGDAGGYMHHFTLKKLKKSAPEQLGSLIQEFIVDAPQLKALNPKPRAPRGSRKKRDLVSFNRLDIERLSDLARKAGLHDLLAKLSPKRSVATLKRELIRSIKANNVSHELWNGYVDAVTILSAKGISTQENI